MRYLQDQHGFVLTDHCDSTLFSGLLGASGYRVDMTAAEVGPGHWLRRPTSYPECWGCGKSRSTISRDMLLGVYWWAWANKDRGVLERMWDYGVSHFWLMCRGRMFGMDTVMNPAMIATLAELIYRLGGKNHWFARRLPTWWSVTEDPSKYYVNRLTALHLGLRLALGMPVGLQGSRNLAKMRKLWPDNPLFAWACRHIAAARNLVRVDTIPSGVHSADEYPIEREFVRAQVNV